MSTALIEKEIALTITSHSIPPPNCQVLENEPYCGLPAIHTRSIEVKPAKLKAILEQLNPMVLISYKEFSDINT